MIGNVHGSLVHQLKTLNRVMERKANSIKTDIDNKALSSLERAIQLETMINLTHYSATGSARRDPRIVQAFDLMSVLVGFVYNHNGSFTRAGARDVFSKNVNASHTKLQLKYTINGKLEELEDGRVNWKNLKRFFYSKKLKTKIIEMYPNQWKNLYDGFDSLFKTSKDPTMPDGRPYISQALEQGSEYLHLYIKDIVHQTFDRKGRWRDVLGRYA